MEPKIAGALCDKCPLRDEPFVPPYIPEGATVIFVGEAPGHQEVVEGAPFVGPSGKLLRAILESRGVDYDSIHRTNLVCCRPPGNREPTEEEQVCCFGRLERELESSPALVCVTLGKPAKLALVGSDVPRGSWTDVGSRRILCSWHPAYVLRKPGAFGDLERDLLEAFGIARGGVKAPAPAEPQIVETIQDLIQVLHGGSKHRWWAFDLEADQLQWYDTPDLDADKVLSLQIAWQTDKAAVITPEVLANPEARVLLQKAFDEHKMIGHNASFDQSFLDHHYGIGVKCAFDTMLAHYILDENAEHGLKEIMAMYGAPDWESDIQQYLRSRNDRYSKIPFDRLAVYAAADVGYTLWLFRVFWDRLDKEGLLEKPYLDTIMPAQHTLYRVKMRGVAVDKDMLEHWGELATDACMKLNEELIEMCGHEYNPNSWKQSGAILWDEMQLPINTNTKVYKKTPRSTANEALEHLASWDKTRTIKVREGNQFVDKLLEFRHIDKMKGSYVDNLLEHRDIEGRVHPDILIHGTEVGRLSFRNPAMQTIPRPSDKWGAAIRSAIVAGDGYRLVVCDYSQAELRVLAALSGDPFLLQVYREDRDLHSEVARAMFGEGYTKEQRVMCKMFNFAYAYGGSEYSFARDAGLPLDVAKGFVRQYDKNMARAKEWKLEQVRLARSQGYVETRFGRRRRFPLITDANAEEIRKACVHMPVAGTASDLTLHSAIEADTAGYWVVLTVHDSIILEVEEERAEAAGWWLANKMVEIGNKWVPEVPWKADIEVATRWCEPPK